MCTYAAIMVYVHQRQAVRTSPTNVHSELLGQRAIALLEAEWTDRARSHSGHGEMSQRRLSKEIGVGGSDNDLGARFGRRGQHPCPVVRVQL